MSTILNNVCHSVSAIHSPADCTSVRFDEPVMNHQFQSMLTQINVRLLRRLAFDAVFEFQIVTFAGETQIPEWKYHSDR